MIEWEPVDGGRARQVTLKDDCTAWVLVNGEDGTTQFYADANGPADLAEAPAAGALDDMMDQLSALDIIDIVCRSLGNDIAGPIADA